jgi:hypothetical protein
MTAEPRDVLTDQLPNLRDVGGLSLESGGRTRSGVLLRSAAPLPGDRLPPLPGWPPATVLDLRGQDELGGLPHPLAMPGTTVHAVPLLDRSVSGPDAIDWSTIPDLATAYRGFLSRGGSRIATMAELAATGEGPVLVHCTAGKDRTGVLVAALLRAAGVRRGAIVEDYLRTERAMPAILARSAAITAHVDPTVRQRMMGVSRAAVLAVLDVLDAAPGGAAGWLREAGVPELTVRTWVSRIS